MRKNLSILFTITIILTSVIYFFSAGLSGASSVHTFIESEDKEKEITGLMEFEFLKKRNPNTNEIPSGSIMHAYTILKHRGYYTMQGGQRDESLGWEKINDFFPSLAVTKITYDPNNISTFYFCTGEGWFNADAVKGAGVFKSIDAGETWEQLAATDNSTFDYCQDIVVHPTTSDIYVATRSGGLQRSTDGGATFKKVLGASAGSLRNSICDIELTSDGGVFVGIGIFETDGIYYSPSGDSATFTKQTNGFPTGGIFRIELATAPSNPDVCYAVTCRNYDYRVEGVYKTIDRGTTWDTVSLPGGDHEFIARQAWYDISLAVDPNNENIVVAGGLNIWRTNTAGETWQQITSGRLDSALIRYMHVDQHEIVFQNSNIIYLMNDGGIYKSNNFSSDGPVFYDCNTGYNVTQYYAAALHPFAGHPGVIGGTQDNGSSMALHDGLSGFKSVSGADGAFCVYNYNNPNVFFTTTQFERVFRFDNGGFEMPDTITNSKLDENDFLFINPIEISPFNPEVLYQASNKGLWKLENASTADSSMWEKASTLTGILTAIGVSVNPPDIVFLGKSSSNGEIYMINNVTVEDSIIALGLDPSDLLPDASGFSASNYCSSISVDPIDANQIAVSYANYGVNSIWKSDNALQVSPVWESIEGDLPDVPVNWILLHPHNPDVAYIATEIGVLYTNDINGASTQWIPCSTFPVVRTDMLRYRASDNTIIAATHGRGIWQSELDATGINNDIPWIERGPTNVGGRTRTLMIDPNDPTQKTIWVGSIAGGLWKTTNIDLVSVPETNIQNVPFNVFPNPASDMATVQIQNNTNTKYTIEVFDLKGNKIEMLADNKIISSLQFDVSNYAAGIYFIIVRDGKNKRVQKLIVQ